MNFKDNLKKIRKDNNLSQEELAEKLNVTRQSVSKWESGAAYPEMDKVIQICKMFNVNIDDLLNKDIKEVNEIKESKNSINKCIDAVLNYVTKTVNVFSSLKFSGKVKCIFEQLILIGVLVALFAIIGGVGSSIIYTIFGGTILYDGIRGLCEAAYIILAWGISIALLAHIFKVRYLDYYEIVDSDEPKKETKKEEVKEEKVETKSETKKLDDKREKIIIRDEKHSEYRVAKGLLNLIVFFIKFIVFWIAFGFLAMLVGFIVVTVLSFAIMKSGILFAGVFTMLIACIIITILLLIVMFNFIFNRKNKVKTLGISFLVSVIFFGVGIGLLTMSIKNFTYIDDVNNENYIHEVTRYEMTDDLTFYTRYVTVDYVVQDRPDVKLELITTKYNDINISKEGNTIYFSYPDPSPFDLINGVINDINNYVVVDQDNVGIIIYANKDNIDKLESNYEKMRHNSKY